MDSEKRMNVAENACNSIEENLYFWMDKMNEAKPSEKANALKMMELPIKIANELGCTTIKKLSMITSEKTTPVNFKL